MPFFEKKKEDKQIWQVACKHLSSARMERTDFKVNRTLDGPL